MTPTVQIYENQRCYGKKKIYLQVKLISDL